MKKNAFLTFIFACIPGAGQMYYGYMKRGLSLITFFCLFIMAGTLVDALVVGSIIVWMYSFFDTYDLIRYLVAGEPKQDALLLPANWSDIKAMLPQHNKLLGWGLVGLGIWALYDIVIVDWLTSAIGTFFGYSSVLYGYLGNLINGLPSVIVGVLLIFVGIKLLGLHPAKKADKNEDTLPPYPNDHE